MAVQHNIRILQLFYLAGVSALAGVTTILAGCSFDKRGVAQLPVCGNGVMEPGEVCDAQDTGANTCEDIGYVGGTLACLEGCDGFDDTGCEIGHCGDAVVNGSEECDAQDLDGQSCESLGYTGGTLRCGALCRFDVNQCFGSGDCGNGLIDAGEVCDGANVDGQDCASLGLGTGQVTCLPDCLDFETTACSGGPNCGDGIVDANEACDPTAVISRTCEDEGYASGPLGCLFDCSEYDVSGCKVADGGPCLTNVDCDGGICWDASMSWPDGYCTRECTSTCPGDGVCVYFPSYLIYRCVDTCTNGNECRTGYTCADHLSIGYQHCWPP